MVPISAEQFASDPKGFLDRIAAGESFVVTRDDQPVAEVRPFAEGQRKPRQAGSCRGEFVVPDDFDDPLPEEILREFEGG